MNQVVPLAYVDIILFADWTIHSPSPLRHFVTSAAVFFFKWKSVLIRNQLLNKVKIFCWILHFWGGCIINRFVLGLGSRIFLFLIITFHLIDIYIHTLIDTRADTYTHVSQGFLLSLNNFSRKIQSIFGSKNKHSEVYEE